MLHEVWAFNASTALGNLSLGLALVENISDLQLLKPRPVNFLPGRIKPRLRVLGKFLVAKLNRFYIEPKYTGELLPKQRFDVRGSTFFDVEVPDRPSCFHSRVCHKFQIREWDSANLEVHSV